MVRRRRMSAEARKAAGERLAKARAERAKKNPPKLSHIHPDVLAKGDDHPLCYKNVKAWLVYNKALLPGLKKYVRSNAKGALAELLNIEGYIRNLNTYLRTGVYLDLFYGADQDKKIKYRTVVEAGTK